MVRHPCIPIDIIMCFSSLLAHGAVTKRSALHICGLSKIAPPCNILILERTVLKEAESTYRCRIGLPSLPRPENIVWIIRVLLSTLKKTSVTSFD